MRSAPLKLQSRENRAPLLSPAGVFFAVFVVFAELRLSFSARSSDGRGNGGAAVTPSHPPCDPRSSRFPAKQFPVRDQASTAARTFGARRTWPEIRFPRSRRRRRIRGIRADIPAIHGSTRPAGLNIKDFHEQGLEKANGGRGRARMALVALSIHYDGSYLRKELFAIYEP